MEMEVLELAPAEYVALRNLSPFIPPRTDARTGEELLKRIRDYRDAAEGKHVSKRSLRIVVRGELGLIAGIRVVTGEAKEQTNKEES